MKKTALAVMVGTLAMAGTAHSETELGVGLGLYKMDSSRDVDNDVAGKISLGHRYDSTPNQGAEIAHTDVSAEDDADASFDASLFQVDGLYHFDKQGGWEPYLAAGIGKSNRLAPVKTAMGLSTLVVALDMRWVPDWICGPIFARSGRMTLTLTTWWQPCL